MGLTKKESSPFFKQPSSFLSKIIGVIPARFGSTRFPGKMLVDILGKSLIQRTYERAILSNHLEHVVVATDDERIYDHVSSFGGHAVMSSPSCPTGTDRIAEVVEAHFPDVDIVVNIQGDEPCLDPEVVDILIKDLMQQPEAVMTTPVVKITAKEQILNPSIVKCVFSPWKRALYFSRSPIPFPQKELHEDYYRHVGIYCFKKAFLLDYAKLPKTRLQQIEDLEQLKILEHGFPIYVSELKEDHGIEVNIPEDIKRVEEKLCKENTSLLQAELSPL